MHVLQQEFALSGEQFARHSKEAKKLETRLNTLLGGYMERGLRLDQELTSLALDLVETDNELYCFAALDDAESKATPVRVQKLKELVASVKDYEMQLQKKYAALAAERAQLEALLAAP